METETNVKTPQRPDQDVQPCKHMEGLVSACADGTLKGPALWYTKFHAMHCTQCRLAIDNLKVVIHQVSDLRGSESPMPADRRADMERALDDVDGAKEKHA